MLLQIQKERTNLFSTDAHSFIVVNDLNYKITRAHLLPSQIVSKKPKIIDNNSDRLLCVRIKRRQPCTYVQTR